MQQIGKKISLTLASLAIGVLTSGVAQADTGKSVAVSQSQLTAADKDANNFLHSNMNYAQTRYSPQQANQHRQRQKPASCFHFPN